VYCTIASRLQVSTSNYTEDGTCCLMKMSGIPFTFFYFYSLR